MPPSMAMMPRVCESGECQGVPKNTEERSIPYCQRPINTPAKTKPNTTTRILIINVSFMAFFYATIHQASPVQHHEIPAYPKAILT